MDADAEKKQDAFRKRQEARIAELQRKQKKSSAKRSHNENVEAFAKSFNDEMHKTTEWLEKLNNGLERSDLIAKFDEIMLNLKKIQKSLTDSVMFLPDFEVKHSQKCLQKLTNDVNKKRDELLPRKKFAFKTRTKNVEKTANDEEAVKNSSGQANGKDLAEGDEQRMEDKRIATYMDQNDFGFNNKTDTVLVMNCDECRQKDIKLSNLENCTVKLFGCPSALHITNLNGCKIFSGPVSRASFVSDCKGCHFSLACQQVRIHTTKDSIFNIHVTGKAIIEDCSNVGFAPYNWSYDRISEDFKEARLRTDINKWNDVDDFNWLKLSEPSPNWYKVPVDRRSAVNEPS